MLVELFFSKHEEDSTPKCPDTEIDEGSKLISGVATINHEFALNVVGNIAVNYKLGRRFVKVPFRCESHRLSCREVSPAKDKSTHVSVAL